MAHKPPNAIGPRRQDHTLVSPRPDPTMANPITWESISLAQFSSYLTSLSCGQVSTLIYMMSASGRSMLPANFAKLARARDYFNTQCGGSAISIPPFPKSGKTAGHSGPADVAGQGRGVVAGRVGIAVPGLAIGGGGKGTSVADIMAANLSSVVPFRGQAVKVGENEYACTSSKAAFAATVAGLEAAANAADAAGTGHAAVAAVATRVEAAMSVRFVAANPGAFAAVKSAAAAGNPNAAAVVAAVGVSRVAGMKAAAEAIAAGMQAGNVGAFQTAQRLAAAASNPNNQAAVIGASMVAACCDKCAKGDPAPVPQGVPNLGPMPGPKSPTDSFPFVPGIVAPLGQTPQLPSGKVPVMPGLSAPPNTPQGRAEALLG